MKYFEWNEEKNNKLKKERNVCFQDVVDIVSEKKELSIEDHPDKERYPNQKIYIVNIKNYVYLVPFVETEEKIFLKTIIPSRKATKKYIGKLK